MATDDVLDNPPPSTGRVVVKTIASIILAYPLSGAIYAIAGLIKLAFSAPASLKNIGVDFFMIALWTLTKNPRGPLVVHPCAINTVIGGRVAR